MSLPPSYVVRNIKLSIIISNISKTDLRQKIIYLHTSLKDKSTLTYSSTNFFVYRDPITASIYTFFFSGHINVTRVVNEDLVDRCISSVILLLRLEPETIVKSRIDNISVSGSFPYAESRRHELFTRIVLTKRPHLFRRQHYNNTVFPNAFLTPRAIGGGTIIFSRNLKYSLVGCKSLTAVESTLELLMKLLQNVS